MVMIRGGGQEVDEGRRVMEGSVFGSELKSRHGS